MSSTEIVNAAEIVAFPRVVHQGRYRLYEKADGTLRIQYRRDDKDEDDFFEFPGQFIELAKSAAEGNLNPMQMMNAVMKFMGGLP